MTGDFGLYLHLPFCEQRCGYCDFPVVVGVDRLRERYARALVHEIRRAAPEFVRPLTSVYVGGGTPSHFPLPLLEHVLTTIRQVCRIVPDAEWSIEANPESATADWLAGVRRLGFSRLSLGAQSWTPAVLRVLGRLHDAQRPGEALRAARRAGFASISLDLMYGCPGQTEAIWAADLDAALLLEPDHLSMYALSLEERTRLARQVRQGLIVVPDEDEVAQMYERACAVLGATGWEHYEISNWARPGHRCRHNLTYWRRGEYVGAGLGAHSHLAGRRYHAPRRLEDYLAVYESDSGPRVQEEMEVLSLAQQLGESVFLGLRTSDGIDTDRLRAQFGPALLEPVLATLRSLAQQGLVDCAGTQFVLSPRGRLISDSIFCRFV